MLALLPLPGFERLTDKRSIFHGQQHSHRDGRYQDSWFKRVLVWEKWNCCVWLLSETSNCPKQSSSMDVSFGVFFWRGSCAAACHCPLRRTCTLKVGIRFAIFLDQRIRFKFHIQTNRNTTERLRGVMTSGPRNCNRVVSRSEAFATDLFLTRDILCVVKSLYVHSVFFCIVIFGQYFLWDEQFDKVAGHKP